MSRRAMNAPSEGEVKVYFGVPAQEILARSLADSYLLRNMDTGSVFDEDMAWKWYCVAERKPWLIDASR